MSLNALNLSSGSACSSYIFPGQIWQGSYDYGYHFAQQHQQAQQTQLFNNYVAELCGLGEFWQGSINPPAKSPLSRLNAKVEAVCAKGRALLV